MSQNTTGALLNPGNVLPGGGGWQSYTPAMTGATDNPVPTFSTQIGRFLILQNLIFFKFKLVSTTMTKTTLTDNVQVTLPVTAATNTGEVTEGSGRVENGTAVANMMKWELASGAALLTYRNYTLAASSSVLTYAVTTPGIGVLTNTITLTGTGFYEY
jgi:hypothetical protein